MEATMPSSIWWQAIRVLALGTAVLAPALALGIVAALVSASILGQEPVNAPLLSSAGPLQDADFRLSDHQQLRRTFFRKSHDRLR
jgi:hypothetical protein